MKKQYSINELVKDISDLKIQSATTITETSLKVVREEIKKERIKTKEELKDVFFRIENTRITEPFVKNCFDYIFWQIEKENITELSEAVIFFDLLLEKLGLIKEQIVKNGEGLIKNGFNIFTHCHSTNVEEILKRAFKKGVNFTVYLTETRPKYQGRIMAENLVNAGIKVIMMVDSLTAFLISREDKVRIDLVILGTDAIFPDGDCYNKVGSYGIALSAKGGGIPLYVVGSLLKFSQKDLPIEERQESEIWENKPKKLKIFNPSFDRIPHQFISGYITEFGVTKPEKVESAVRKNYPWIIQKPEKAERQKVKPKNKKLSHLSIGEVINKEKNIIATFRLESEGKLEESANELAAESSVGTWTELTTQTEDIFSNLGAKVFEIDKKTKIVKVAYPLGLFEPGNISQLLSCVAGNIFGMKKIRWLRLLDLDFPENYVRSFPGPEIGADKIREITGVYNRPFTGCIIKPKMGLSWREHTKVTTEVFEAGIDLVKDDENLTDQSFNPFEKRVIEICESMKKNGWLKNDKRKNLTERQKGERIYSFNITAETEEMIERAKFVKENGGNCVMLDIVIVGFSAIQTIRKQNFGLILHGHRAMHAALTKNQKHGISMTVLAKLSRLSGIDQLHTGTVIGKMEGIKEEIIEINKFLLSDWYGLKKTLPIASGGLHPGMIPDLIEIFGDSVILNFGGGIHGHPMGSRAGVLAVKQAIEAVKKGIDLENYAKSHQELKVALEWWGNK